MKKIIKALTVAVLALAAVFACAFAVGCNKSSNYEFTVVYEDGKAVNGQTAGVDGGVVNAQLCLDDGACVILMLQDPAITVDANGKLTLTQKQVNDLLQPFTDSTGDVTEFVFHVRYMPGYKDDCEVRVNGAGKYKLTVTK